MGHPLLGHPDYWVMHDRNLSASRAVTRVRSGPIPEVTRCLPSRSCSASRRAVPVLQYPHYPMGAACQEICPNFFPRICFRRSDRMSHCDDHPATLTCDRTVTACSRYPPQLCQVVSDAYNKPSLTWENSQRNRGRVIPLDPLCRPLRIALRAIQRHVRNVRIGLLAARAITLSYRARLLDQLALVAGQSTKCKLPVT
jgi:hypothetical protein